MKIPFDLDGVLANISEPMHGFHNHVYGTNVDWRKVDSFDLSKLWGCTYDEYRARVNEFYCSPFFDLILPFEDAKEGIALLDGHEKLIITARPAWLAAKSFKWLERFFHEKFPKKYFNNQLNNPETVQTKASICVAEKADYIVEDHVKYARECAEAGIKVLLRDRGWNKHQEDTDLITRIHDLREIAEIVGKADAAR